MGKKILWGLGIFALVIILVVFGFMIYMKFNSGDIPKPDDSSLYPSSQILSEEENAFSDFKKASDGVVLSNENVQTVSDLANNKNWDSSFATEIIKDNSMALVAFKQGTLKKGYQDQLLQNDLSKLNSETVLSPMTNIRRIAQISVIESRLLFEQGKKREAFDNTLKTIQAGQMLEDSPRGNLLSYLVGMSIKGTAITNLQSMIANNNLTSSELRDYASKIEKFKNNRTGLQEGFKMEYMMMKNTKEQLIDPYAASGQKNSSSNDLIPVISETRPFVKYNFYYKPNETQKLAMETYKRLISNSIRDCNELLPPVTPREKISLPKILFTENSVGKILNSIIEVSLDASFKKRCDEEFSVIKTQISLASQAYKIDKGSYPDSLSQLYPKYLNQEYKQFNGEDIMYNTETGEASISKKE